MLGALRCFGAYVRVMQVRDCDGTIASDVRNKIHAL